MEVRNPPSTFYVQNTIFYFPSSIVKSMLNIVATPIGNLKDITLRALEAMQNCDGIICEDTRRAGLLLRHYQIQKPLLLVLNDFNEVKTIPQILEKLKNRQNLVLISDAGTPLISDPGFKLIRECLKEGIEVDSLPGPSSVITALTLSGLPPDKFMFLGFLPDKPGHRQDIYQKIADTAKIIPATFIIFVAPFKLKKTLEEMEKEFGDIEITLAKELTKIHQNTQTKTLTTWVEETSKQQPKGEFVLLFRPNGPAAA